MITYKRSISLKKGSQLMFSGVIRFIIVFLLSVICIWSCREEKDLAGIKFTHKQELMLKTADSFFDLGKRSEASRKFREAKQHYSVSDSIYQLLDIPDRVLTSKIKTFFMSNALFESNAIKKKSLSEALDYVRPDVKDTLKITDLYGTLAFYFTELDRDVDVAKYYARKGYELIKENTGNDARLIDQKIWMLKNLARSAELTYDYQAALKYHAQLIAIAPETHDMFKESYNKLFSINSKIGQLEHAKKILKTILDNGYFDNTSFYNRYDFYSNQIEYYTAAAEYDKALLKAKSLQSLIKDSGFKAHFSEWGLNSRISKIHLEKKDYKNVLQILSSIEGMDAKEHPDPSLLAGDLANMARAHYGLKNYEAAQYTIQKALHYKINKKESVPSFFDKIDLENSSTKYSILFQSLLVKAELALKIYNKTNDKRYHNTAIHTYTSAYKIIKLSGAQSDEDYLLSDANFKTVFGNMLENYHKAWIQNKSETVFYEALELSDEGRNIMILNDLKSVKKERLFKTIPKTMLDKERQLNKMRDSIRIHNITMIKEKAALKPLIDSLTLEINHLKNTFKSDYPRYYELQYGTDKPIREHIKNNFKDTNIIEYFWADDAIYIFNIQDELRQFDKIPLTKELLTYINELTSAVIDHKDSAFKTSGLYVYEHLFKKYVDDSKKNIMILDDKLHVIPVEALWVPKDKGHFLLEDINVSRLNSISQNAKTENQSKQKTLLFAPFANQGNAENTIISSSLDEVKAIKKLFRSTLYLDEEANKDRFTKTINDASIIHLATHASVNTRTPLKSRIHFYESKNSDPSKTSMTIEELYNLKLNSQLVTLSACETGLGKEVKGKGLLSMSRAFNYAGASCTIMSLWKVPDQETSEIMIVFYKYLREGLSKDEALRKSKIDFIKNSGDTTLQHPFYWSGFVISGDTSPIKL